MTNIRIVVLRQKVHGMEAAAYAEVLRSTLPDCQILLAETPAEEREYLANADVATGTTLTTDQLERAGDLSLFTCVYAGTDHLDLDAFRQRDIAVTNASGVHSTNSSEYAVGSMIALARQFPRAWRQKQHREWRTYPTRELHDSTAAVIGMGAIGTAVVDCLDALGMQTVGVRYTPEKGGPTDDVYGFDAIHDAVADAEYVVVACRLTETTDGLIDMDVLRTMPANAILVNVARGAVVDTADLVYALQSRRIAGAALDVTDPEPLPEDHSLWRMENVLITPHNAGNTPEYFDRCADILAENVEKIERGEDAYANQVV